jgi:hypothetical protein
MVDISEGIQFRRDGIDPSQWPVLSCSQANQLALGISDLRLDANREIFLQGNGQLRSSGDMLFLTGGSSPEKLRILADGNIGIGTAAPTTKLDVNGIVKAISFQGDGSTLEGLVRKTGDTITGPLTIQNALTVSGNVGIGTTTPSTKLDVNGTVKATSFQGDGSTLEGLVRKTGDTMTGPLTIQNGLTVSGNVGIGTTTPSTKLDVNGTIKATSFQGDGSALANLPGRTQWSNTGSDSISYSGSVSVNGNLTVIGNIIGRVTGIGIAIATLQHGQSAPIPAGFTKEECVFITAPMWVNFAAGESVNFKCFVNQQNGQLVVAPDASQKKVMVQTVALAKKGGW